MSSIKAICAQLLRDIVALLVELELGANIAVLWCFCQADSLQATPESGSDNNLVDICTIFEHS